MERLKQTDEVQASVVDHLRFTERRQCKRGYSPFLADSPLRGVT